MAEEPTTRERILEVARQSFLEKGYHRTPLSEIADELGITKAALYYHFRAKDDLLIALVGPFLERRQRLLDELGELVGTPGARARILAAYFQIELEETDTVRIMAWDVSVLNHPWIYERMRPQTLRWIELLAGPDAGLDDRVRASSAMAVVQSSIYNFPDVEIDEIRDTVVSAATAVLESRTSIPIG